MVAVTNQILALISGDSWAASSGTPVSISYTILGEDTVDSFGRTVSRVNPTIAAAVAQAVAAWNAVANINIHFVNNSEVDASNPFATDPEDIQMVFDTGPVTQATDGSGLTGSENSQSKDGGKLVSASIKLDNRILVPADFTPGPGQAGFQVVLRAIGQALGLSNPEDDGLIPSLTGHTITGNEATLDGTIMHSLTGQVGTASTVGGIPLAPQIFDIAAIQFLYGANHNYRAGDDTYTFSGTQLSTTLWDGGGTDTLSFATSASALSIDLREGIDYVTAIGETRIWIAAGANIENAIGSSAGDTVTGNALGNRILGNMGADTITGNEGNDSVRGGKDADSINGNAGNDSLYGDMAADSVRGGADNDLIHGGRGNDTLLGETGNDIVFGDRGDDSMSGGTGDDTFAFGADSGVDIISDFAGNDVLQISSAIFASVAAAVAASAVDGASIVVDLGGGNSITLAGVGAVDTGDFVIV